MRPLRYTLLTLVLALAALLAAPGAHAQIIPKFGATGGLNFGSLSDAGTADFESSTGYHIGIFGDVGIGPLAARLSVLYVSAGSADLSAFPNADDDESVNFIAVPLDLKFRFPSPIVKPYALLGPELRFPQGGITNINTESYVIAGNIGLGAELDALIGPSVFAELRYGFDLSGFANTDDPAVSDDVKVNVFYLRVGVGL